MFFTATIAAFAFFLAKFLESRFNEETGTPLKIIIRDTLLVYVSVVLGIYVIDQVHLDQVTAPVVPSVFTDNAPF